MIVKLLTWMKLYPASLYEQCLLDIERKKGRRGGRWGGPN